MASRITFIGMRCFAALALFAVASSVGAATCTWLGAGANANWSTAANWNCGGGAQPVPAQGDVILFLPGLVQPNSNNDIPGLTLASIQFTGPNYVVTGLPISLTGGIVANVPIGGATDTDPTLGLAITLAASGQSVQCTGARGLVLAGALSLGSFNLDFDATCTIAVQSATSGGGGVRKVGSGTVVFSGANTYTGTTTVDAGTLRVASDNALGGTSAGTVVNSGGALEVGAFTVRNELLTLNGTVGGGAATLRSVSGSAVWTGAVNLGTLTSIDTMAGTTLTLAGTTSGGSGLAKAGVGQLILAGANTYAGPTTVAAGVLLGNGDGSFGAGGAGNGTTVQAGAQLQLQGSFTVANELLTLNGSGIGGTGTVMTIGDITWNGATMAPTGQVIFNIDGVLRFNGTTSGAAGLTKIGAGTLELGGSNTYTGLTLVNEGVLSATTGGALGGSGGAGTTVGSGATLQLAGSNIWNEQLVLSGRGFNSTGALRNVSGDNTWTGTITLASDATIANDAAGAVLAVSGPVGGSAGLTKIGAGTLSLDAVGNNYDGLTTVSAGTLRVAGSVGPIVLDSAGTLAPLGVLNADSLTWNGGGTLEIQIVGGSVPSNDRLQLSGNLTRGTGSTFRVTFGGALGGANAPSPGQNVVAGNYIGTNFVDTDFSHEWVGEPTSVLTGEFVVAPTQLEFHVISLSLFQDGFEGP